MVPTVIDTPLSVYGNGPKPLIPDTTPWRLGAKPGPVTVVRPHGTRPGAALLIVLKAALKKLFAVSTGPGGRTVSVKVALNVLYDAMIVTGPAVAPAVAVVNARPWASVVAPEGLTDAEPPLTEKVTLMPETGLLLLSRTETTSGCANAWLAIAV